MPFSYNLNVLNIHRDLENHIGDYNNEKFGQLHISFSYLITQLHAKVLYFTQEKIIKKFISFVKDE